jgi:hypothetical protein
MLIARLIERAPRMSAISASLLFFIALLTPLSLSADRLAPSSIAERLDHRAHDRNSGSERHPEHELHDDDERSGGELGVMLISGVRHGLEGVAYPVDWSLPRSQSTTVDTP